LMPQPEQIGVSGSLGGTALADGADELNAAESLLMLSCAMKESHLSPELPPSWNVGVMLGLNSGNEGGGGAGAGAPQPPPPPPPPYVGGAGAGATGGAITGFSQVVACGVPTLSAAG
jgi:hypothetical protein